MAKDEGPGAKRPRCNEWRVTIRLVNPMMSMSVTNEEVQCEATTTVRELAERFAARIQVPAASVRLIYNGILNDMDATLASLGVENHAVINALVVISAEANLNST